MDQFVETHNLLKLLQEESNLNGPVSSVKIESAMRNLPKQAQDKVTSLASPSNRRERLSTFLSQTLSGEGRRTLPNSLMRPVLPKKKDKNFPTTD